MIYDLIVLGGECAGYLAAERAGKAGLNTLLIEKASLGGVCLSMRDVFHQKRCFIRQKSMIMPVLAQPMV